MVELTGSEKQIKWAADIRGEWLSEISRLLSILNNGECDCTPGKPNHDAGLAGLLEVQKIIEAQKNASWFIDHRRADLRGIGQLVSDENYKNSGMSYTGLSYVVMQ